MWWNPRAANHEQLFGTASGRLAVNASAPRHQPHGHHPNLATPNTTPTRLVPTQRKASARNATPQLPTPRQCGNISERLRRDATARSSVALSLPDQQECSFAPWPRSAQRNRKPTPSCAIHRGTAQETNAWRIPQTQPSYSGLAPAHDLESAVIATLPANGQSYTAIVRGTNNTTGIGVVEIYDLDRSVDSKLANISSRGLVQTGDNALFAGTIVVGQANQRVIIRALGPSLSLAGKMEDPKLELRDSNGALMQANDNWVDSPNKQEIMDSTIPPTHDLESAIVATLPANDASYTAIVRGVNDTTGIAVVEVYALQ